MEIDQPPTGGGGGLSLGPLLLFPSVLSTLFRSGEISSAWSVQDIRSADSIRIENKILRFFIGLQF
jgi:hypothetical protein